jgi:hypothetical protein
MSLRGSDGNGRWSFDFVLNLFRVLIVSGTIAIATGMFELSQKVAVLEERIAQVLAHSDKRDEAFDRALAEIERRLTGIANRR